MAIRHITTLCMLTALATTASPVAAAPSAAQDAVWRAELAFAGTLAARDLDRFGQFVSAEAVFFSDPGVLRGRAAVLAGWSRFFEGSAAPFSWEPDRVEVLESGGLALSTGPVRDRSGTVIARFNSIWRLESDGHWRVVFDKGSPVSPAAK